MNKNASDDRKRWGIFPIVVNRSVGRPGAVTGIVVGSLQIPRSKNTAIRLYPPNQPKSRGYAAKIEVISRGVYVEGFRTTTFELTQLSGDGRKYVFTYSERNGDYGDSYRWGFSGKEFDGGKEMTILHYYALDEALKELLLYL